MTSYYLNALHSVAPMTSRRLASYLNRLIVSMMRESLSTELTHPPLSRNYSKKPEPKWKARTRTCV